MSFDWTPDAITELRRLVDEGRTCSEIGKLIGCGKNAALSKAHRLNLPARPSCINRTYGPLPRKPAPNRNTVAVRPKPVSNAATEAPAPGIRRPRHQKIVLPVSKSQCKWPIGHPGDDDFHFCTAKALQGKPYCAEHCSKAYVTVTAGYEAAD